MIDNAFSFALAFGGVRLSTAPVRNIWRVFRNVRYLMMWYPTKSYPTKWYPTKWYPPMLYSTTYSQNSSQANQAKSRQLTSLHWMIKGDKIRTLLHAYTTFMLMAYYAVRSSSLLLALMSNLPFLHCSLFPTKLFQTYQQYHFRSIIPIANSCLHDKLDVKWLIMSGSNNSYKEKYNSVIWLWFELPKYAKHNSTETAF